MNKKNGIRDWPYPYIAGLAISNDAEYMSFEILESMMEFLNTKNRTILGKGLNLEITTSIFHYSDKNYNCSIFDGLSVNSPLSKNASRLAEYLSNSFIDTLHAYGDFDNSGGFNRSHALKCFEHLNNINAKVSIFTNHGDSLNLQNIGIDAKYHKGDLKNNSAYHSDLLKNENIKFVWTDSMIYEDFTKDKKNFRENISKLKKKITNFNNKRYFSAKENSLIKEIRLRDRNNFYGFRRFRGTGINAPNLSSLKFQLDKINWSDFYNKRQGIIIYQHLGILKRIDGKCYPVLFEDLKSKPEIFLEPFYFLSEESQKGLLWVSGCGRFLAYLLMIEQINSINYENGIVKINYKKNVQEPIEEFQGLTVYIDPINFKGLFYNEIQIPTVLNRPDEKGLYSVSVPLKKLPSIWN